MILVLDNYDSFVHNVARGLRELGAEVVVARNDPADPEALLAGARGVVLSPGPCTPRDAGISIPLVRASAGRVPLIGVCLGHQAVAEAFCGGVVQARRPLHGVATPVIHDGRGLFRGLPPGFPAGRYHSLVVDEPSLPPELTVTARSPSGELLGLAHRRHPIHGVQFHPESILTPDGHRLLANFLDLCRGVPLSDPAAGPARAPRGVAAR
jgi:anthranilate synthase/aminodeoxychorismate synthase-like glutamine amidotransferase